MQWKDSEDSVESNDEETEIFNEEEYSPLGVSVGAASNTSHRLGSPIIWVPAVVIILILLYIFLPTGNGTQGTAQLKGLEARLDQVEKRMLNLEGVGERVLNLEKTLKDSGTLEKQLDRLEASIAKRLDQVDKELLQLRKDMQAKRTKTTVAPTTNQQKSAAPPKATQHVVKKGDTLYSIGRTYGLTVDRLRTINKLDKNSVIFVGQKLTVK